MAEPSKYSFGKVDNVRIFEKVEGGYHENNITQSPETSQALTEIKQLIQNLAQKHSTPEQNLSPEIIEAEIVAIEQQEPQRRQTIINALNVAFAGGVETIKVLFPYAGIPIEVGLKLYEIWQKANSSKQ